MHGLKTRATMHPQQPNPIGAIHDASTSSCCGVPIVPGAAIGYRVDTKRQGIVDSWPAAVDDSAARRDWGFDPQFDFERAFREYLIPTIRRRYHR